jgi:hypothetical protein
MARRPSKISLLVLLMVLPVNLACTRVAEATEEGRAT